MKMAEILGLSERQRLRRDIKAEIGALRLQKMRVAELEQEIKQLELLADQTAAEHVKRCAPIQAKLDSIEARMKTALGDRLPVDKHDAAARGELLEQLSNENRALADASERTKKQIQSLANEREVLRRQLADLGTLEAKLTTAPLGSPGLLDEFHVQTSRKEWARKRAAEAEPLLAAANEVLADPTKYVEYSVNVAKITARTAALDLADAHAQMTEAVSEMDRLRNELLAE